MREPDQRPEDATPLLLTTALSNDDNDDRQLDLDDDDDDDDIWKVSVSHKTSLLNLDCPEMSMTSVSTD